jgi:Ty3 transposon capsid-like protein
MADKSEAAPNAPRKFTEDELKEIAGLEKRLAELTGVTRDSSHQGGTASQTPPYTPDLFIRQQRNPDGSLTFNASSARVSDGGGFQRKLEDLQSEQALREQALKRAAHNLSRAKEFNLKLPAPAVWAGDEKSLVDWLFKLELYLSAKGCLHEEVAVSYAAAMLDGPALTFWISYSSRFGPGSACEVVSFEGFKNVLLTHFQPQDKEDVAREKLRSLRQETSVKQYCDRYAKLMIDLPRRHERDAVADFVQGLKTDIRVLVNINRPASLEMAMQMALAVEQGLRSSLKGGGSNSSAWKGGAMAKKDQAESSKSRSSGSCHNCGAKDHWADKCPLRTNSGKSKGGSAGNSNSSDSKSKGPKASA